MTASLFTIRKVNLSHFNMIVSLLKWIALPLWMFGSFSAQQKDTNCNPDLNIKDTITLEAGAIRYPIVLNSGDHLLEVKNLQPNEVYQLWLNADDHRDDCRPKIHWRATTKPWTIADEESHSFRASQESIDLLLSNKACPGQLPVVLTLACTSCVDSPQANAESFMGIMTDHEQYTVEELVKDIFIGGDCFQIEDGSITVDGSEQSFGYFNNGMDAVGMEEGIILSSGRIENASGPNDAFNTGNWMTGINYDPDLTTLIDDDNFVLYDGIAIEFDFTPTDEIVSFEYVFASEEYCEYVDSDFNDVFGFFISGPGINGPFSDDAENIAIVPGTSDYISINSINHLSNSFYYQNNIPVEQHNSMPLTCDNYPMTDGVAIDNMEYDGFTNVMTAMANVIPCETYHIKLIIADLDDGYYDSAVFLKANSFSAGGTANVTTEVPGFGNNEITESCTDGFFVFERTNDDLSADLVIDYSISNLSTATAGVDYDPLPTSITIPAGDSVFYLPVTVYEDALVEGTEQIILEMDAPCSCEIPFTEILILDGQALTANAVMDTLCFNESVTLVPETFGGLPGYTYLWSTTDTTETLTVSPASSTDYELTITDFCGNTATTTIAVEVVDLPTATISGFVQICSESPQSALQVDFTGVGPWRLEYSIDNISQTPLTGITDNPFQLPVSTAGTYLLQNVIGACEGMVAGAGTVMETQVQLDALVGTVSCPEANDGSIAITVDGGQAPYTYQWSNTAATADLSGLTAGNYWVTVHDFLGCEEILEVVVPFDPSIPSVEAGTDALLNCSATQVNLGATASVGSQYAYLWSTPNGQIVNGMTGLSPLIDQAGMYILAVTNLNTGCVRQDTVMVVEDISPPVANILLDGVSMLTCTTPSTLLSGMNAQPNGEVSYLWSTNDGVLISGMPDLPNQAIEHPGTYTLLVTNNINGCTHSTDFTITENIEPPVIAINPPPTLTCSEPQVQLDASASASGTDFSIQWSTTDGNLVSGQDALLPVVDAPGTYQLTIVNLQTGCENSSTVGLVEDVATPTALVETVTEYLDCDTEVLTLSGEGSSLGAGITYQWSTATGQIISGEDGLNPIIAAPGIYELMVTDQSNGCTAVAENLVEQDLTPPTIQLIALGSTALSCNQTSTVLNALGSAPVGQLSFDWTTVDGFLPPASTNIADPEIESPGTYELTVTNLVNGCTSTADILITLDVEVPQVNIAPPATITCFESMVQLDASLSTQGPDFILEWNTTDGNFVGNPDHLSPTIDAPGTYQLTITNLSNGCSATQSVSVGEDRSPPFANAGNMEEMLDCNTPTLQLNASASSTGASFSYRWTSTDGRIVEGANGLFPLVDAAGVYQLLVTNQENGCIATDEVRVEQNEDRPYDAEVEVEAPLCFGDLGAFGITQIYGGQSPYLISIDGGQNYFIDTAFVMAPGNYTLLIQDANGCDYEHQVLIPGVPELQVDIASNLEIQLGEQYQLIATVNVPEFQIDTIIWTPAIALSCTDCLDPIAAPLDFTTYQVTVVSENGCIATNKVEVAVQKVREVYIPNAFSPNEDSNNDLFMIYANEISIAQVNEFRIFSRWGELLYSAEDFAPNERSFAWDGRFRGQEMSTGVYIYFAEIEFIDGVKKMYKGDVVLMR
ncbi:MAG: choice-of-anchor L domain-containing protein [Bacteroidota bacterium]